MRLHIIIAAATVAIAGCSSNSTTFSNTSSQAIVPGVVQPPGGPTPWQFYTLPNATKNTETLGLAVGPDKNIWFTDWTDNIIGRITMGGAITEFTVPTTCAYPERIASGPDGALWFTEPGAASCSVSKIGRITTHGVITEFQTPTLNAEPFGIVTGADGNLWFSETNAAQMGMITPSGVITEYALPAGVTFPFDVTVGPDNNVWFTTLSNYVGNITPSGSVSVFQPPTTNSGPFGIVNGKDGTLWFTEQLAGQIGQVSTAGVFHEYKIQGRQRSYPTGITRTSDGRFWFSDGFQRIGRITADAKISLFPSPDFSAEILQGPDGNLWFTDEGSKIGVFVRYEMTISPSSLALAVNQSQNLTVSERIYHRAWTAVSSAPSVATVAPAGPSNQFTVTGVGSGTCTIMVSDDKGNSENIPVKVN